MIEWLRKRSLPVRILVYASAATLAFALAAGVGATGALIVGGDLGLPGREAPRPPDEQENAPRSQEKDAADKQEEAAPQEKDAADKQEEAAPHQGEAEYVGKVGDIQGNAIETFLDSHDKLLRYDALTADDIEEMQANQAALRGFAEQTDGLDPPQSYRQQHETFKSAINELYEAVQVAYSLAADPTTATQSRFDEYDQHVNEAAAGLQRSNEILGRDFETIRGVQRVNPLS
jgi:hypothetical protein